MSGFYDCLRPDVYFAPTSSAHFVLHSTGDVTAMLPFPRARLKSDEPATRLADMSDVARATREAKDYTDDMFARLAKRLPVAETAKPTPLYDYRALASTVEVLQHERDALAKECDFLRITNVQAAKTIGEMQTRIDQNAAFVKRLQEERDNFRDRMYRQAETINEMQGEANSQNATIANLEREREHIREGREKAVARCVELEEANAALRYHIEWIAGVYR